MHTRRRWTKQDIKDFCSTILHSRDTDVGPVCKKPRQGRCARVLQKQSYIRLVCFDIVAPFRLLASGSRNSTCIKHHQFTNCEAHSTQLHPISQSRHFRHLKTLRSPTMADEDVYPADLLNAWKSARLVYRAVEDDEEDKAFIREAMVGDPVALAMGSYRTLAPGSKAAGLSFYELTKHNPLRALICLPAVSSATTATVTNSSSEAVTPKANLKLKPTPIGLVTLFYPRGHECHHHRDVTLGISLAAGHRGKGYGAEAINWVLDWGFRHGGYHRIGLTAFSYNTRALKLYRSLGFVEEGRVRESLYHDRKRYDEIMFGMLSSEWEKLRGIKDEGADVGGLEAKE